MPSHQPFWKRKAVCLPLCIIAIVVLILIAIPGEVKDLRYSKLYRDNKADLDALLGPHTVIDEYTTTHVRNGYILTFTETRQHVTVEYQDVNTGETHAFGMAGSGIETSVRNHAEERLEPYLSPWYDAFPAEKSGKSSLNLRHILVFLDENQRTTNSPDPQWLIDAGVDFSRFDPVSLSKCNVSLECKSSYKINDGENPYGDPEEFIARCIEAMTSIREATGLRCSMPIYLINESEENHYRIEGRISFDPEINEFLFHADVDTRQTGA